MNEQDQVAAAVADAQHKLSVAYGDDGAASEKHMRELTPLTQALFDRYLDAPRCSHLCTAPIQPSYLAPHVGQWGCSRCAVKLARKYAGKLGWLEEITCDLCRRARPPLALFVLNLGFWTINGGACRHCITQLDEAA